MTAIDWLFWLAIILACWITLIVLIVRDHA
jgi:hypothetical protein